MNSDFSRNARKFIVLLALSFMTLSLASVEKRPRIGLKVYEIPEDAHALLSQWKNLGIDTLFISRQIAENAIFMALTREHEMQTFIIAPIFYNPEALANDPDLYAITGKGEKASRDWVQFVCPTRDDYRRERIREICAWLKNCRPDGISLDFIRYFVFWEMVYPDAHMDWLDNTCFCPHCLARFAQAIGHSIPADCFTVSDKARWIRANHAREWIAWKCEIITSMVRECAVALRQIDPSVLINVHLLPWRIDDFAGAVRSVAGQDVTAIGRYVDFLSPMCYWHMVKRPPAWIHSVVDDIAARSKKPILASIQVAEDYIPGPIAVDEFTSAVQAGLKPPSRGIVFWNWPMLSASPEKQAALMSQKTREMKPVK